MVKKISQALSPSLLVVYFVFIKLIQLTVAKVIAFLQDILFMEHG